MNNNHYYNGVQHYYDPPILESYKKHLTNKRENNKIIKFCFGGMESQGQLMPKLSLYEGIETEGPKAVIVLGGGW